MNRITGIVNNKQFSGQAPLVAETSRYWLGLEGTVYNAAQLGQAENDARLILELVERHGVVAAAQQLNADFALVVYDKFEDTLWLARDRFGVLPLYYLQAGEKRAAAARPRVVAAIAGAPLTIDENFIARYAGNHYRGIDQDSNASPYTNIAQVPAATVIRLSRNDKQQYTYWSLSEQPDWTASPAELAEQYRGLLLDAVTLRLTPGEKHAFTLSGGMDSSTVVASAALLSGQPQPAFSTVYNDPTFDESQDIQPMLARHIRPWHPIPIKNPDVFTLIQEMIALHDEPVVTATWLSHYLLVRAVAAKGYTTLWGGLGGDELNAGEYEYFMYHFADLARAGQTEKLAQEVAAWVKYHDHPVWRKSAQLVEQRLKHINKIDTKRMWRYHAALTPAWAARARELAAPVQPFTSYLKNRTFQDLTRETLPCCLRAEDRHAAAFGISRRLPFLDYRLVEFMFRVPGELKIRHGVTKYLLREATRGILPEATRTRIKKTGWNAPAHRWFIGPGKDQLQDLIHSQSFRQRGIYNLPVVEQIINEHEEIVVSGRSQENHMMFLWQLVNLELWLASENKLSYTTPHVKEKVAP